MRFTIITIIKCTVQYIYNVAHRSPELFHPAELKVLPSQQVPISFSRQPLTTIILLSVSLNLMTLGTSYKLNRNSLCLFVIDVFHLAHCPQGSSVL